MPATAADLGVLNPFNALENIRGGTRYLRRLLTRYDNNEALALAAYNAGPGAVDRYGSQVPPYRETQDYVKRILGSRQPATAVKASVQVIYQTTEIINGRAVTGYSSSKPASGPYRVMKLG
jgi:soluble lytic murein transglycosylase-like protein